MATEQEKKEAMLRIDAHIQNAYRELELAEQIADEFEVTFQFGTIRGMGGEYRGKNPENVTDKKDNDFDYEDSGWISSTAQC